MSNRIHALAQQLTGKTNLDECTVEEIQRIAAHYPYFAPAQFLLLQKLKQTNNGPEAEDQHKKAVLFYHDPLQFEYFISSEKFYTDEALLFEEDLIEEAPIEESVETEEQKKEETEHINVAEINQQKDEEAVEVQDESFTEVINSVDEADKTSAQQVHEDLMRGDDTKEVSKSSQEEAPLQEVPAPEIRLPEWNKETASSKTEEPLSFEPFHTVDYFASQGIKISQEELPKDKLGKQLKSFTAWLKTMKRLPATPITESIESSAEKKVETMADHSVTESEVVTEAMAEVWAKQGNREKAMETYNKLSLLNPSKRAYFAAKIQNLK